MSTATIENQTLAVAPVAPLTATETNSLIEIAAGAEKIARVKGSDLPGTSRGFSMAGDID